MAASEEADVTAVALLDPSAGTSAVVRESLRMTLFERRFAERSLNCPPLAANVIAMQEAAMVSTMVSAMWLTVAILAGGFARTRNRSPWYWFLLTLFLGPIAAFLLVVWPPLPTNVPAVPSLRP